MEWLGLIICTFPYIPVFFLTNYFTSSVIFPYVGLLAYINQSSTNGLNFVFSMSHNAGVKIQCTFALAAFPYPNCSCPLPSGRSKISSLPSQADGSRALPSAVPSRDPYCCHVHKHIQGNKTSSLPVARKLPPVRGHLVQNHAEHSARHQPLFSQAIPRAGEVSSSGS